MLSEPILSRRALHSRTIYLSVFTSKITTWQVKIPLKTPIYTSMGAFVMWNDWKHVLSVVIDRCCHLFYPNILGDLELDKIGVHIISSVANTQYERASCRKVPTSYRFLSPCCYITPAICPFQFFSYHYAFQRSSRVTINLIVIVSRFFDHRVCVLALY